MSSMTTGDMAQTYVLRLRNTALKSQMTRLAQEMTTGQTANLRGHLDGSYGYIAQIENSLGVIEGQKFAADEARLVSGAMQAALESIQSGSAELGTSLLSAGTSTTPAVVRTAALDATARFQDMVGALNGNVGGRALFAGAATDSAALTDGAQILADLSAAVSAAGAASYGDVETVLDDWFNAPGGGYETTSYTGASQSLAETDLGAGVRVTLDIRADDPEFREMLKAVALAAMAADDSLGLSAPIQRQLVQAAGEQVMTSQDSLTRLRADLGYTEARVEESQARIAAERSTSIQARNALLEVDPYEAATQLERAQFQLESLYSVTVRLSRMSLAEYMR